MSALSSYIRINLEEIDPAILDRISEREVMMWCAAKLENIRAKTKFPILTLDLDVWHRGRHPEKNYYDVCWGMHAPQAIAMTHESTASAIREIRDEILNNPGKKAADARFQAKLLIEEAEKLETVAKG